MKFKDWLESGLGGTSMEFGGASVQALDKTNSNMPVRSKYVTMDRDASQEQDAKKQIPNPDKSFGFQTPKQKKASIESQPSNIDRGRKAVPTRDDDLFVTY
jgi:hypothetical protein